jgi:hypothetical protein
MRKRTLGSVRWISLCALAAPLLVASAASAATLTAHYPLDSSAADASGANRHGTVFGGFTFAPGACGAAAKLNGTNQYIKIPAQPLKSYSVSAWFNMTVDTGTWQRVWDFGNQSSGAMVLAANHGRLGSQIGIAIHKSDGVLAQDLGTTIVPLLSSWYHVVVTYEKGGQGSRIWVNGQLRGSGAYNAQSFDNFANASWYLAKSNWADPLFAGLIDEVRIYDGVLTSTEIVDLHSNPCGLPPDADGDGVPDASDACPGHNDAADTDGDGTANGCDACPVDFYNDGDGDGSCDSADACPLDPANDADGDSLCADADACPSDPANDADGDGICGEVDVCPIDAFNDADGDGVCGNVDVCAAGDDHADADSDGTANACDLCPSDPANDADGDGACADMDACPLDPANDGDVDGFCADVDPCPLDPANDADGDDMCADVDACAADTFNDADGDGLCADVDNCPSLANSDQADFDLDGAGDTCDADDDGDGSPDAVDNCPFLPNGDQANLDGDGAGDVCDFDDDGDGLTDETDKCLSTPEHAAVNDEGCAIADLCPCTYTDGVTTWKNHGAFVSCVAKKAGAFLAAGLITGAAKDAIVSAAASSSCGSK